MLFSPPLDIRHSLDAVGRSGLLGTRYPTPPTGAAFEMTSGARVGHLPVAGPCSTVGWISASAPRSKRPSTAPRWSLTHDEDFAAARVTHRDECSLEWPDPDSNLRPGAVIFTLDQDLRLVTREATLVCHCQRYERVMVLKRPQESPAPVRAHNLPKRPRDQLAPSAR